jgi:hypothetical protein
MSSAQNRRVVVTLPTADGKVKSLSGDRKRTRRAQCLVVVIRSRKNATPGYGELSCDRIKTE